MIMTFDSRTGGGEERVSVAPEAQEVYDVLDDAEEPLSMNDITEQLCTEPIECSECGRLTEEFHTTRDSVSNAMVSLRTNRLIETTDDFEYTLDDDVGVEFIVYDD